MPLGGGPLRSGLCWGALGLAAVAAVALPTKADARRHRVSLSSAERYEPPYASIVVDANSGAVMQATNADSPRHPASLTKIMTLYLLFERLEQGKIKLNTELPVSAHAAVQAPSKLGLKPGDTITVETAIRAIVTKSANDVAVIVAEALGGDEPNFARMMTAKAHALGMNQTAYNNASGLPDEAQITTARDQSILARAIQDKFPNYYRYFSTRTFDYRGHSIRNHNHLLGAIDGLDGIKTGYIRESGFNIVTSIRRANRHIVTVVFGGRTAEARDARVRSLIDNNINIASIKRTAPPVTEGWETAAVRKETKEAAVRKEIKEPTVRKEIKEEDRTGSAPIRVAAASPPTSDAPIPGSTDPIKPTAVKTVSVHPGVTQIAALSPLPPDSRQLMPAANVESVSVTNVATVKNGQAGTVPQPAATPSPDPNKPAAVAEPPPKVASASPVVAVAPAPAQAPGAGPAAEPAAKPRSGWIIQVGAMPDEKEARERLEAAQNKAKALLGKADPFTERIEKGDKILFRARFAGLEKTQAEAACKHLKRSEIPCMLLKN